MNRELTVLQKYFSAGSAEQEKEFIADIFVKSQNFQEIVTPPSRSMRLLVGSKGSGKSALLEYLDQECERREIPVISLKPVDVEVDINGDAANSALIQKIYKALVREIAIKVGTGLGGVISNEQEVLVREAVDAGARQPMAIDQLLRVLAPIGKAVTNIDLEKMVPDAVKTSTRVSVDGIDQTLQQQDKVFYVLFDDIDQFGDAGSKGYLDTIWCAILAFKTLAERLPNVRAIVTLRNEIWRRICDGRQNLRDQVDHVRPMVCYLLPTTADMKKILNRRLAHCKSFLDGTYDTNFAPFFETETCKMPSSSERRLWKDYLVTASRERPRDTVQLVQHLVNNALRRGHRKINDDDVEETALAYSKERVDDVTNENADLCPQLETVIRAFAALDFQPSADEVKKLLLGVPGKGRIEISKKVLTANVTDDMFRLWKILYDTEFLTPRIRDVTRPKDYRHVRPSEDSTLVSAPRWNDMQKYVWEIHPCYRSYLMDIVSRDRRMKGFRS